jgi:hypothetical protein
MIARSSVASFSFLVLGRDLPAFINRLRSRGVSGMFQHFSILKRSDENCVIYRIKLGEISITEIAFDPHRPIVGIRHRRVLRLGSLVYRPVRRASALGLPS